MFRLLRKRPFATLSSATVVSYSTMIEYRKYTARENARSIIETGKRLSENTVMPSSLEDDIIVDNVGTGDIILFNRRWSNYHLPVALMINLYKEIHQSNYDHCGIIIHNKFGDTYILESCPFSGMQYRPFSDRILHSQASIDCIPLSQTCELSEHQRKQLHDLVMDKQEYSIKRTELWAFINDLLDSSTEVLNYLIKRMLGKDPVSAQPPDVRCSDALLLAEVYNKMGLSLKIIADKDQDGGKRKQMSIKDIENRNVELVANDDQNKRIPFHQQNISTEQTS